MRLHLGVSIWNCIRYIDFIHVVVELEVKTHCIITFGLVRVHLIDFHMVWGDVILNIESTLKPPLLVLFVRFETPKAWLHSIVEKTVSFCKVDDVNSDHVSEAFRIAHLEVKPL